MTAPGRLRVGVVGAGMISQYHLVGWRLNPHADLVAICDPELARASQRAAEHGVSQTFASREDMLDACSVDAVDILTPVATHAPLVRIAADRGVHVMCQKPITATLQEARALHGARKLSLSAALPGGSTMGGRGSDRRGSHGAHGYALLGPLRCSRRHWPLPAIRHCHVIIWNSLETAARLSSTLTGCTWWGRKAARCTSTLLGDVGCVHWTHTE